MKTEQDVQKKSVDIFLELAGEAESTMKTAGESARKEASEATEKFLLEYEQKLRQILLKTRESARLQASEISGRFDKSLMERIMETSVIAMSQIMSGIGPVTEQMTHRLQKPSASQAYRSFVDSLKENLAVEQLETAEITSENHTAVNPESFQSWLTQ